MTASKCCGEQCKPINNMLTTGRVARIFKVHASTIRRWSEQGLIKSCRTSPRGKRWFRHEAVAIAFLDRAIGRLLKGKYAPPRG